MPIRTTRSGREVKNSSSKQSKVDALELLARQRRGEKVDVGIKEDEPLFEEVDEEEYKRTRRGGFVVDKSDDEYDSDDADFIDDNDDYDNKEDEDEGREKKRPKGKQRKLVEKDPRQKSMKSFMGASSSAGTSKMSTPSIGSSKKRPAVDEDDILNQMLYQDVPPNRSSAITRKPTVSRLPTQSTMIRKLTQSSPSKSALSASQALGSSRTRRVKADQDTPSKRTRVSSPVVMNEDTFDDLMPDLPADEPMLVDHQPAIYKQMATQESVTSAEEENDTSGIEAAPLDEDSKNNLEFLTTEDGKSYTRFYWLDCCEGQTPGTVYFFGRINAITAKRYVSCCVIVKNVRRTVYLMVAPDCTYEEASKEFSNIIAKKWQIKNFSCELVKRKYAFSSDSNNPLECEFVKVEYPATQNALPSDLKGETFSKILNITQSPMEKLILELKLRGPCWMRLLEPVASTSPLTWTRIELVLESPNNLAVETDTTNLKAPYFCVLSLALQTHAHPTIAGRNDIIAISVMVNTTFNLDECLKRTNKASGHFLIMAKPSAAQRDPLRLPFDFNSQIKTFKRTKFELVESERDLLTNFMDKFNNLDPDIVVGHDLLNFDFETLVKQMAANKVGTWSKLGRFKRTSLVSTKKAFPYLFSGRVLCDIKKMAEELLQLRSYDLTELTSHILDRKRIEYNHASIVESFRSSENLIRMLNATWEDVDSIFSILVELNIIPLALKITNITGNIFSRTLAAGRSERNEYLLLHAFHEDNFICPEKQAPNDRYGSKFRNTKNAPATTAAETNGNEDEEPNQALAVPTAGRRKAAYTGGLVLEPKAGFYETCILLMDFNSLYPSIIQEFNICFSTVKVPENSDEASAIVPSESVPTGILPAQLKNLVDRRRQVKRLMADSKSPMQKTLLDIEQRALKLTANSMYGCLGFEFSRFYAKHLASLVTFKGREILMNTKALVESLGYDVIYGDTDSLMIDTKTTDYDDVMQKGSAIKSDINRKFKLLEIDIDGVYRPLLLLKKKNYAGASIKKLPDGSLSKTIETKGLDSVRRDRAVVAKEAGEKILSLIMESDKDVCQIVEDIHSHLKQLASSINNNELPLSKYLISKQLNKNPEEYRDTKGIGHVTIALRYNNDPKRAKKLRAGDVVDYVICVDSTKESANQRCYTLEEMKNDENLKIDFEYYLCQQLFPAVSRICDKMPFTNAYVIAEALGIESNSSLRIPRDPNEASKRDQLVSKGQARFNSCEPMTIFCPCCNNREQISNRIKKNSNNKTEYCLTTCGTCGVKFALKSKQVVVQVIGLIKKLIQSLYNPRFTCSDCETSTRNVFGPISDKEDSPLCYLCSHPMVAEMNDIRMDLQLNYYKFLLDTNNPTEDGVKEPSDDVLDMYQRCHGEVVNALRMSFINTIDAQKIFSMVCS